MTQEKGQSAEAKVAIASTAAQADGVTKPAVQIAAPVAVEAPKEQPKVQAEEVEAEPTKRSTKKAAPKDVADILDDWADE
jgi:hypothetical protein